MMEKMSIHQKIRQGRLDLKMTEQQFADALDVSRGTVQQWEKENGTAPKRKRQPDVAKLLGITVAELMGNSMSAPSASVQASGGPAGDEIGAPVDTLKQALAFLAGYLEKLSPSDRSKAMREIADLVDEPETYAKVAASIEARVATSIAHGQQKAA